MLSSSSSSSVTCIDLAGSSNNVRLNINARSVLETQLVTTRASQCTESGIVFSTVRL